MNLRQLWDTAVLRDLLGYIFPGAVTLTALFLMGSSTVLQAVDQSLDAVATQAGPFALQWANWLISHAWLALALAGAVSYAIGLLQAWIIELLEKPIPSWNLGKLALVFLQREGLGDQYAQAGVEQFYRKRKHGSLHPLVIHLSRNRKNASNQRAKRLALHSRDQRERVEQAERQRQAEELWRLCDRYVLHHSADAHAMFMGRYYILAVFFSNLGLSTLLLGVVILATGPCGDPLAWAVGLAIMMLLVGVLSIDNRSWPCADTGRYCLSHGLALSFVAATVLLSLWGFFSLPHAGFAPLLLGSGAVMLARSSYFRRRFVECTFPIFYAIVQAEERSRGHQA